MTKILFKKKKKKKEVLEFKCQKYLTLCRATRMKEEANTKEQHGLLKNNETGSFPSHLCPTSFSSRENLRSFN